MRAARWGYIIGIHAVLLLLIWKTDAIELITHRFGHAKPQEMDRTWARAVAQQREWDAQLAPGTVVFLGDSLIVGLEVGRFGRRAVNYGIGFDTTSGVLARLGAYPSLATASAVVLLVGINDLMYHRDVAATAANHRLLVSRLAGVPRLLAIGLLPVGANRTQPSNDQLRALNDELQRTCATQRNCRYVDAWPGLTDGGSGLAPANDRGDGLHLSAAGYERLAAAIAPGLAP